MLDDVAARSHTKILRAVRRAIIVALGAGPESSGEAFILAEPYRTVIGALPTLEDIERRVQGLAGAMPAIATMAVGLRDKEPDLYAEIVGLVGDLGYGDVITKYLEPVMAVAAGTNTPAAMQAALRSIGFELHAMNDRNIDKLGGLADRLDLEPDLDEEVTDEGNLLDEHGLTPDDRRRWSQAIREGMERLGHRLDDQQTTVALDFLMGRMIELEAADEANDDDAWPDVDHVEGAERVQLTIPVDVLGSIVLRAAHVALMTLPTEPKPGVEVGTDEHAAAIARVVARAVERALVDGRRKLAPVGATFRAEARELVPGRTWARMTPAGVLEVSTDGQQGIGLTPTEAQALIAFALRERPDLFVIVTAAPPSDEAAARVE